MKTAIVQYNAGNICSVINALRRIGVEPIVTSNPEEIKSADRVIFPGQGEAATTIAHLKAEVPRRRDKHKRSLLWLEWNTKVVTIIWYRSIGVKLLALHSGKIISSVCLISGKFSIFFVENPYIC
mgnify:CR=1 FL=1